MMPKDVADYLVANVSLSLTQGTNLFMNWKPESPNQIVVLSDYSHDEPVVTMGEVVPSTERPRLQVLVRDEPSEVVACEDRCRDIYEYLCALKSTTINAHNYTAIPRQTPTMVGRDEQQRVLYVVNFDVVRS